MGRVARNIPRSIKIVNLTAIEDNTRLLKPFYTDKFLGKHPRDLLHVYFNMFLSTTSCCFQRNEKSFPFKGSLPDADKVYVNVWNFV